MSEITPSKTLHTVPLHPLALFLRSLHTREDITRLQDILVRHRAPESWERADERVVESSELPLFFEGNDVHEQAGNSDNGCSREAMLDSTTYDKPDGSGHDGTERPPMPPKRYIQELRLDIRSLHATAIFALESWRRETLGVEGLVMESIGYPPSIVPDTGAASSGKWSEERTGPSPLDILFGSRDQGSSSPNHTLPIEGRALTPEAGPSSLSALLASSSRRSPPGIRKAAMTVSHHPASSLKAGSSSLSPVPSDIASPFGSHPRPEPTIAGRGIAEGEEERWDEESSDGFSTKRNIVVKTYRSAKKLFFTKSKGTSDRKSEKTAAEMSVKGKGKIKANAKAKNVIPVDAEQSQEPKAVPKKRGRPRKDDSSAQGAPLTKRRASDRHDTLPMQTEARPSRQAKPTKTARQAPSTLPVPVEAGPSTSAGEGGKNIDVSLDGEGSQIQVQKKTQATPLRRGTKAVDPPKKAKRMVFEGVVIPSMRKKEKKIQDKTGEREKGKTANEQPEDMRMVFAGVVIPPIKR